MIKRVFEITSEAGIHARPATTLVNTAMVFDCDIQLTAFKRTVDFKSIMGVMSLGIYRGSCIEITCNGQDEKEAIEALTEQIVNLKLGHEVKI